MNKPFYGTASITASKRSQIIQENGVPGPGSYDPVQQDKTNIPQWTLKPKLVHGSCFQCPNKTPAVGQYNLEPKTKNSQLKANQSTTKIQKPDKYKSFGDKFSPISVLHLPSSINPRKGYVFGSRDEVKIIQTSPGPIYDPLSTFSKERSLKKKNSCSGFGLGNRNGIYKQDQCTPGPGAYQTKLLQTDGSGNWSFSQNKKYHSKNSGSNLGPGQYNINFSQNKKNFKFLGKLPQPKIDKFKSGPGSYEIPDIKGKIGGKFGLSKQKHRNSQIKVSPFSYQQKRYPENALSNTSGFSMGKLLKKNQSAQSIPQPGPGSYELQNNSKKFNGGYIGRKLGANKKLIVHDNFHKYDVKLDAISREGPKYTFPKTLLQIKNKENAEVLGPGSYNLKQDQTQSYSFGKQLRWKKGQKEKPLDQPISQAYSTIGYLPSYLKNTQKQSIKNSILKQKTNN